jgi:RNA polymerase sigma-70 factor (ECF subfamily)
VAHVSEDELIERARQGDGAAWETLVREHQEPAYRLAYLMLGDAQQAEDVTQEAFIRAYRGIEGFDATRPFRPWMLSITANLARNQRRSLGRYFAALRSLVSSAPDRDIVRGPDHIEGGVSQRWETQTVWRAIRRLDQKDQQVIYLRYFLEVPIAEAAAVLGVAEGTVKSRTHRALNRLQAVIDRDFPSLREGWTE